VHGFHVGVNELECPGEGHADTAEELLIGNGSNRASLAIGYLAGGGIMIIGGGVEAMFGINAEGKSLEAIAPPLTEVGSGKRGAEERDRYRRSGQMNSRRPSARTARSVNRRLGRSRLVTVSGTKTRASAAGPCQVEHGWEAVSLPGRVMWLRTASSSLAMERTSEQAGRRGGPMLQASWDGPGAHGKPVVSR
jgi:hypothetical protein